MIHLAKKTLLGRNKTRLELWEEHLKDPIVALDKALKCVESSCWGVSRPEFLWWKRLLPTSVGKADQGGRLASTWIQWIVCVYAQQSVEWNEPGKYGPNGELFFFLIQKEPATEPDSETFSRRRWVSDSRFRRHVDIWLPRRFTAGM